MENLVLVLGESRDCEDSFSLQDCDFSHRDIRSIISGRRTPSVMSYLTEELSTSEIGLEREQVRSNEVY